MPTYDYSCTACGHTFEIFERIHEEGIKPCPKCGKKKANRKITASGAVIFKGSGFHVTDYKRGSAGADQKKKTTRKIASKPETKPETHTDTKSDKTEKK